MATREKTEQVKKAEVALALAEWKCPEENCDGQGAKVYKTVGRIRYVVCKKCGEGHGKVVE